MFINKKFKYIKKIFSEIKSSKKDDKIFLKQINSPNINDGDFEERFVALINQYDKVNFIMRFGIS